MGKYIVDLPESYALERAYGNKWLQMPVNISGQEFVIRTVIPLTPYTEPDTEKIRKEAFDDGYQEGMQLSIDDAKLKEAYQRGLSDAWECARKIALDKEDGGLDTATYCETFGYGKGVCAVLKTFTASEAIEKIRQYEQDKEQEIRVGDEVEWNGDKYVITYINGVKADLIYNLCGSVMDNVPLANLTKTGRHFPGIAEVLRKMREEEK